VPVAIDYEGFGGQQLFDLIEPHKSLVAACYQPCRRCFESNGNALHLGQKPWDAGLPRHAFGFFQRSRGLLDAQPPHSKPRNDQGVSRSRRDGQRSGIEAGEERLCLVEAPN
jgi:hypothetical protein